MFPTSPNEADRLAALHDLAIVDTQSEVHFDAVCRTACDLFEVPIALIAFVEAQRQWFKAKCGMSIDGTTREIAFCNYTILNDDAFVVEDAATDPRFATNRMVTGDPCIRFYAGVPLALSPGIRVGTLCIKDVRPRTFSQKQIRQLQDLAAIVVAHLRLHEAKRVLVVEGAALQAAYEAQRVAETAARFGHWRIDAGNRSVLWSDGVASIFGSPVPKGGILPLDEHLLFYHPDERDELRARIEAVIAETDPAVRDGYQGQARVVRPDGEERIVMIRGVPVRDATDTVTGIHGIILDVSEQSRTQDQLRATGELLRMTLENMDQGLILYGPDMRVRLHNRRARELLDLPETVLHDGSPHSIINEYQIARSEFRAIAVPLATALDAADLGSLPDVYERERPNGTSLEVRVVRLPDGSYVRTYTDITLRIMNEQALKDSETRYRVLADAASDMIVRRTIGNVRTYVSPASLELLGYSPENMLSLPFADMLHPEDRQRTSNFIDNLLAGRVENDRITHRLRHSDGHWVWIEARSRLLRDVNGAPVEIITAARDVSERVAAEEALRASETRLRASEERLAHALDSGSDGLWDWDLTTKTVWLSERWYRMLGYEIGELEPHIRTWTRIVHPEDRRRTLLAMRKHLGGHTPGYESEYRLRTKRGVYIWVLTRGKIVGRDGSGRALRVVGTQIDITHRKEAEQQIAHMATHDGLTGLPNRVLFRARLDLALATARRHGSTCAVLALDLDRFKNVNDTLGHPAGDTLLRVIADRLQFVIRDGDTVARLGGDEFAIIVSRVDGPQCASLVAQRVIDAVGQPVDIDEQSASVGVSIGIALGTHDSPDVESVFKNADIALYCAKAAGRNSYSFHESGVGAAVAKRSLLKRDLRDAVHRGGFVLHYQPIVNLAEEKVSGFEALLRWQHPTRGAISPAEFIPLAEEIGLFVALGEWAIREACQEAASWNEDLRVAVNVSAVQFQQPGLEQIVLSALVGSGLSPHRLELEITESMLMQDSEAAIASLHRLKGLGIRIALDDFGTGFSSLSYLRRFPFDKIKIDRSFIRDIGNPDTAAIVRAIVGIGEQLGATITAEGVETREQLKQVRQEGCSEVQGFLYSRPMIAAEALAFAHARQTHNAA